MSGHSKWATIKHKKAAVDKARGKLFAKLARQIEVAAREGGGDPDSNAALRTMVLKAKAGQMTNDAIDRAIKRGTGEQTGASYESITYEGYAPGGVALLIDVLTDNRNRTSGDVRSLFSKYGGQMGETVAYQFDRLGQIQYPADKASADQMLEAAIEAGADDCQSSDQGHDVYCASDSLNEVREALEQRFGPASLAKLVWRPQSTVPVEGDAAQSLVKLLDALDDHDDIQNVYANFEMSDETLAKVAG